MKAKPNWNELEAGINFASIAQRLANLVASGALKRRKTASDLLDKVTEGLVQARANGVSLAALVVFLKENGLPVSEPTLRHYLRKKGVNKRQRRTKPHSQSSKASLAGTASVPAIPQPHTATAPSIPSLKIRQHGPRIADARNL